MSSGCAKTASATGMERRRHQNRPRFKGRRVPARACRPVAVAGSVGALEKPMERPLRVLVVGCGNMGASHARAYHQMPEFEIVGLVSRGARVARRAREELGGLPEFGDFHEALRATRPDVVSDQHLPRYARARIARAAIEAGCHVFCEKPLGDHRGARRRPSSTPPARAGRKLVVGYILRVHPSWMRFIEIARTLGKPLVMRMNLNQQSHGPDLGRGTSNLMDSMSPIVDCGVHYVDVMCQMTGARPVRVSAIGARLTDELKPGMYNYGQLQVIFDDGSVGWYEAGWGPMMSETAFFVKDVVGPKGCVIDRQGPERGGRRRVRPTSTATRRRTACASTTPPSTRATSSCGRTSSSAPRTSPTTRRCATASRRFFLRAIREDLDLSDHMDDAVNSLRIVLAADESVRRGPGRRPVARPGT